MKITNDGIITVAWLLLVAVCVATNHMTAAMWILLTPLCLLFMGAM